MLSTSAIIGSKAKVTAPATPTGLSVFEVIGNKWGATWNVSSGATGYKIQYEVNSGGWTEVDIGNLTEYYPSTVYDNFDFIEVRVAAYNSGGQSAWSGTQSVWINPT